MGKSNFVFDNLTDDEIVEAAAAGIAMVERLIVELKLEFGDAPVSPVMGSRLVIVDSMNNYRAMWLNEMSKADDNDDWYDWHMYFSARIHLRRAVIQMRESGTWIDWFPSA